MIAESLVCPELVARDAELNALVRLRRAASQGHGSLVLVGGEAGIGKSRLIHAFRDTLSNGRAAQGAGVCREFGNVPFGPIADALRDAGVDVPIGTARTRPEQFSALQAALAQKCERRNTVLLLEDLHWADEGTLRFLMHLLPALPTMRLCIVATYRSEEEQASAGPYLARFSRDRVCHRVLLERLPVAALRRIIKLALHGTDRLSGNAIDAIAERSEGNPFFAEELIKSALERHRDPTAVTLLPLTIRAAVSERLARLDAAERHILELAAVLGRQFDVRFLTVLCDLGRPAIFAALRHGRDLQLIEELPDSRQRFTFRHSLTRDAIYDGLLAAELPPLHVRIVRALEREGDANAYDLGYHAWAAEDPERCVHYNERAGDEADDLHSYLDAVRCFERAMHGAQNDETMGRLLGKAAASSARDGNSNRAVELYEAAAQAYERSGSNDRAAENFQAMSSQARIAGDSERAMAILQQTLRSPASDSAQARLGLTLAFLHLDRGDVVAATEILGNCREAADTPAYHNTCSYLAMIAGNLAEFRRASARYIDAASQAGDDLRLSATFNFGFGLAALGIDEEALVQLHTILPELRERRLSSLEVLACANAALVYTRRGELREARDLIERGLRVPEPATTGPIALASAALHVAWATRDHDLVARSVTPSIIQAAYSSRINSTLGRFAGPYARWLQTHGNKDAVANVLRRAVPRLTNPFASTETLLCAVALGDAWTRERAIDFLPALDRMSDLPVYAATALHLRALDASHRANPSSRETALQAGGAYALIGWPSHEAECRELAGDRTAASGLHRRAAAPSGEGTRAWLTAADNSSLDVLSTREREIAHCIANGDSNKALAVRFAVNQRTVEKHLTSIYGKVGVRTRAELAAFVARSTR